MVIHIKLVILLNFKLLKPQYRKSRRDPTRLPVMKNSLLLYNHLTESHILLLVDVVCS